MDFSREIGKDAMVTPRHTPPARRNGVRITLYVTLVILDMLAIVSAFQLALSVQYGILGWRSPIDAVVVTLPIYFITAFNNGAYSIDVLRRVQVGIARSSAALLFAFAIFLLISYYFNLSKLGMWSVVNFGMIGSFGLVAMSRLIVDRLVKLTIGQNITSDLLILDDVVVDVPPHCHILDARLANLRPNMRDPMMLDRLARHLRRIDRVIVACRPEAEREWSMVLKGAGIHGEIVSTEFDTIGAIGMNSFNGHSTLVVVAGPLSARNRMIKRLFDLTFTIPALIVLVPVLAFTALAIKLDSRGPVFFRQQRVGRGNALFEVFKFRSMRAEDSDVNGTVSASRDDNRVTRVGRIIRATSIDELPQLLNVLFGSMSIVGPRPHALGSLAGQKLFWEVDERYWHRHALKPGITGLAQVRGFRGATHGSDDLSLRLQADLEYIIGWSVLRDFAILLSTTRVIVHRNAF